MTGRACGDCAHWKRDHDADRGQCRRYAPRPDIDSALAMWPLTLVDDWCGEFQPPPIRQSIEVPPAAKEQPR